MGLPQLGTGSLYYGTDTYKNESGENAYTSSVKVVLAYSSSSGSGSNSSGSATNASSAKTAAKSSKKGSGGSKCVPIGLDEGGFIVCAPSVDSNGKYHSYYYSGAVNWGQVK
jgi:hypothetical protein